MPSLFDIGKSGLQAYRQSLAVTGQNIANVNTDGYKKRDLLVVLFGSNRSLRGWHPKHNLYSERVKTIKWFEHNAPKDFELYGKKWNMSARLPTRFGGFIHSLEKRLPFKYCPFPSWKGEILNKQDVLIRSRFSIVYENVKYLKGYISEKIFDEFNRYSLTFQKYFPWNVICISRTLINNIIFLTFIISGNYSEQIIFNTFSNIFFD